MFELFHIIICLIPIEIICYFKKYEFSNYSRFFSIIASILPDIIDKPLDMFGISSGRGYAHTILFLIVSFPIIWKIFGKKYTFIYIFCIFMHLILDYGENVPYFYPFIYYDMSSHANHIGIMKTFEYFFNLMLSKTYLFLIEILCGFVLLYIIIHRTHIIHKIYIKIRNKQKTTDINKLIIELNEYEYKEA